MEDLTRRDFALGVIAGGAALVVPGCGGGGEAPARKPFQVPRGATRTGSLRELANAMRGPVLRPGDAAYSRARLVYNERYDGRHPRAVAQPVDTRDVQALVRWAARHEQRLAIRSGGHSYAGYSTTDGGVMVDLRRLRGVALQGRTAVIGPGTQLLDVYAALARHGVTIPAGSCPSVGIGGHVLGGGMGLAGRQLGLTLDSLRAATVVTADGRAVRCDRRDHEDLLWALRGAGGGSFGIVTRLELEVHPATSASWFFCSWPWASAAEVLAAWQRVAPHAPRALTSVLVLATGASAPRVTAIGQYFGAPGAMLRAIAPLTAVPGTSLSSGESGYLDLMRRWAGCLEGSLAACHTRGTRPGGTLDRARFAAKSHYFDRPLGPATALAAVERRQGTPAGGTGALLFDAYGGAINSVPKAATAFAHRDQLFCLQELAYFPASGAGEAKRWLAATHAALRPHASGEAYQNYTDPDLAGWRRAYYAGNYARLTRIKARHDPGNLFRFAQSIPPA